MAHEQQNQGDPSTQERLAISRRALLNQLQGERQRPSGSLLGSITWAPVARGVARHWWGRHPANTVGQLAQPMLEHYAREQPFKLVAAAAAVGALVVLTRPWRLLSTTAAATVLFKTSDVAGVVNALIQHKSTPRK